MTGDEPPLPFADEAFDLVTSRHPIAVRWTEIARVLRPGGTYFAQHIGPATMAELVEYFIGPQPEKWAELHPDVESAEARAAGLDVVDMRMERMRAEFFDIGAVIYFLRKVIWTVPDFTVDAIAIGCGNFTSASSPTGPSSRTPRGSSSRPASPSDQPSSRNTSSACCRSAGYGLTISTRLPSAGWANDSERACSH